MSPSGSLCVCTYGLSYVLLYSASNMIFHVQDFDGAYRDALTIFAIARSHRLPQGDTQPFVINSMIFHIQPTWMDYWTWANGLMV